MNYKCPYCDEILNEEEAESVCDCGCPSCRHYFDVEDYETDEQQTAISGDTELLHPERVTDDSGQGE